MPLYSKLVGGFGDVRGEVRITGVVHFGSEAHLLSFGDRVTIADGVRFLTHDGGIALFRDDFRNVSPVLHKPIVVGDNVFIGANAIILPGVTIGDDVVIGAGAVVTKDVGSRTVVAGCPARPIRSTDEYRESLERKGTTPGGA